MYSIYVLWSVQCNCYVRSSKNVAEFGMYVVPVIPFWPGLWMVVFNVDLFCHHLVSLR